MDDDQALLWIQTISSPNQSEVLIMDPGGRNPNEYSTLFFLEEEGGSIFSRGLIHIVTQCYRSEIHFRQKSTILININQNFFWRSNMLSKLFWKISAAMFIGFGILLTGCAKDDPSSE